MWAGIAQSVAYHYWLDGPGIEYRWGADFLQPSRPALGTIQPPVQWVPGFLSGGVVDHSPPYSAEVKEIVQLYLY